MGVTSRMRTSRAIGSGPRAGEVIPVDTDTHVTGILLHASGVVSTLVMSFDVVATRAARIEIHGETASLIAPDPNLFAGDVEVHQLDADAWVTLPPSAGYRGAARGYGIADMASTPAGMEPRAGGDLAYHVLDVMGSLLASARSGRLEDVASTCQRPAPVALGELAGNP
jgi:predicted dehydrogenase